MGPWAFLLLRPVFTMVSLAMRASMWFKMRRPVKHRHSRSDTISVNSLIRQITSICLYLIQMNFSIASSNSWRLTKDGSHSFRIQVNCILGWPIFRLKPSWESKLLVPPGCSPCLTLSLWKQRILLRNARMTLTRIGPWVMVSILLVVTSDLWFHTCQMQKWTVLTMYFGCLMIIYKKWPF